MESNVNNLEDKLFNLSINNNERVSLMNKYEDNNSNWFKATQNQKLIISQIEYYLSDQNLKRDQFFNEKIKENTEGQLNIKYIMPCNAIKKITNDKNEVIEAVKLSNRIIINKTNDGIKCKNKNLNEITPIDYKLDEFDLFDNKIDNDNEITLFVDNIQYSQCSILAKFSDGKSIFDAIKNIKNGLLNITEFPLIHIVKFDDKNVSLDNRRLQVFKSCKLKQKIKVLLKKPDQPIILSFWKKLINNYDYDQKLEHDKILVEKQHAIKCLTTYKNNIGIRNPPSNLDQMFSNNSIKNDSYVNFQDNFDDDCYEHDSYGSYSDCYNSCEENCGDNYLADYGIELASGYSFGS